MKIGFCNGCFDGFHPGHEYFLSEAQLRCDHLIVAINSDDWIKEKKGESRPLYPLEARIARIRHRFKYAAIVPFKADDPDSMLWQIQPDILFRGWDQQGSEYCAKSRTPVFRIGRLSNFSTSMLAR